MSLHGDIHSPAQQKGLQSGPWRVKNALTNVGQDMHGFFSSSLTQRTRASARQSETQATTFNIHTRDDDLFPEYHWLAEALNKLLESVWGGGGFHLNY